MAPDWHTMLLASLKQERTMQVPSGYYYTPSKNSGACCLYVLIDYDTFGNLIFRPLQPIPPPRSVRRECRRYHHQRISTFLFPNNLPLL